MDFSVWMILDLNACLTSRKSKQALKSALEKTWDKITSE
jgi:hypothetical protein